MVWNGRPRAGFQPAVQRSGRSALIEAELFLALFGQAERDQPVAFREIVAQGRIIDGFAKKMADQFFTRLEEVIEGPKDEDEEAEAEKKGWLKRLIS